MIERMIRSFVNSQGPDQLRALLVEGLKELDDGQLIAVKDAVIAELRRRQA